MSQKPKVINLYQDLKAKGAFSKEAVGEFSTDLIHPFHQIQKVSLDGFARQLKDTLTLNPQKPLSGFCMWNALAFWFGVAETVRRPRDALLRRRAPSLAAAHRPRRFARLSCRSSRCSLASRSCRPFLPWSPAIVSPIFSFGSSCTRGTRGERKRAVRCTMLRGEQKACRPVS